MLTKFRRFFFVRKRRKIIKTKKSKNDFAQYKAASLVLVNTRIEHFNAVYNFKFNYVRIKNATSRWGSCSSKGNLNFNYRVAFLPEKLLDYVVVHELCHLGEFNHSPKFWNLVAKTVPNYMEIRAELKKISIDIVF